MRRKRRIIKSTVVRRDIRGAWWVMNRPEDGWSSYGYKYTSLDDIRSEWSVRLDELVKSDKFGDYVEAHPL